MRAIITSHDQGEAVTPLLLDTRSMVRHLVGVALAGQFRSAITLRKETADWFRSSWRSRYAAHWHHSACSMAIGIVRSYWRLVRQRKIARLPPPTVPRQNRLMARIDQELVRIKGDTLEVTVRCGVHLHLPLGNAMKHRRWGEWSKHSLGEVTLLPHHVVLPFQVPEHERMLASECLGVDLNLRSATGLSTDGRKEAVDLSTLSRIQKDGQKRRESIQRAIPTNLAKQRRVLRRSARRQRNRTLDQVRRVIAPAVVNAGGGRNIIFEDLTEKERMVRSGPSIDMRRKLSRWATGLIQQETERRSPATVVRVNARGTSSECPRCGGIVSHPEWRRSVCGTCGEFDRDFAASLIIAMRGRALLGSPPFAATARASLAELARPAPSASAEPVMKPEAGSFYVFPRS